MNSGVNELRQTFGDGRWFPAQGSVLKEMVQQFIDGASMPQLEGRVLAGIAPHAGYVFSGPVAGHTFRALRDDAERGNAPETLVILGFSHGGGFSGTALLDGQAIQTPLGRAPLDLAASSLLAEGAGTVRFDYGPHRGEHSAENQIPFAQVALPDTALVVGLIGDHEPETVNQLTDALQQLASRKRIAVVASSDMLHHPDYELVSATDRKTLRMIEKMDVDSLRREWSYKNQILCGLSPVSAGIEWARASGASQGKVLRYRNSGDDYPESRGSWVVGYCSVIFSES